MSDDKKNVITGYPHIDKPWLQYYEKDVDKKPLPEKSLYQYMKGNNSDEEQTAINYFNKKISYGEFFENIINAAKVLTALGIKKDDRILFLLPNIPETSYLMYAASIVGAVADYMDPRPDNLDFKVNAKKTLETIIDEKCTHIISFDKCYLTSLQPIEHELKEIGIDKITLVSAKDSMNLKSTISYLTEKKDKVGLQELLNELKNEKKINELIRDCRANSPIEILDYKDLASNVKYTGYDDIGYVPGKIDVICHTSGTSSPKPKPIPLTNDNINAYVEQLFLSNVNLRRGDKGLHILPFFAAFGLAGNTHAGFSHGLELIEVPEFLPSELAKIIKKYKTNIILGVSTWFPDLINSPDLQNEDLSYLHTIISGGSSLNTKEEKRINDFLAAHNSKTKYVKGYGMSETSGGTTYAVGEYNIYGSVGIPMTHTNFAVVDPDTKKFKRINDNEEYVSGELAVSTKAITPGKLDGKVIVPTYEIDGQTWLLTGDYGRIYRDGHIEFEDRIDRGFMRYDGYKIKPSTIEKLLNSSSLVEDSLITPYKVGSNNGVLATIILDSNIELTEADKKLLAEEIIKESFIENRESSARQIPNKIRFVKKIPLTKNNKKDYRKIISTGLTGDEIDIVLKEDNLSIKDFEVIVPENKSKILKKTSK